MGETNFIRQIHVYIGDENNLILFKDLYISIRIRKEATETPAEGTIEIYNLSEDRAESIRPRGARVVVLAGYAEDFVSLRHAFVESLVFEGDIRRVEKFWQATDHVTRLHVGAQTEIQSKNMFVKDYGEGDTSVRQIVTDGIQTLNLEPGPLHLIPADAVESNFSYAGPTRIMLAERLRPLGLRYFIEGKRVRITGELQIDDRTDRIRIDEQAGLLEAPEITENGYRIRNLFNALIIPGAIITLNHQRVRGQYKCIEVEHSGNNWEGDFVSIAELRPLDAVVPTASRTTVGTGLPSESTWTSMSSSMRQILNQWVTTNLHTSFPANIISFDSATRLASVQPAPHLVLHGDDESIPRAPVHQVPVVFPSGGGYTQVWPLHEGDPVWVWVSERGLVGWKSSRMAYIPPPGRKFDPLDIVVFAGFIPEDTTPHTDDAICIQRNDGTGSIVITQETIEIHVADGQHVHIGGLDGVEVVTRRHLEDAFNHHRHMTSRGPSGPPMRPAPIQPGNDITQKQKSE